MPEPDEIRFLDEAEWEAVLRHVIGGAYAPLDRAFYLTAVMAGLRHGELIALRWRDVDWIRRGDADLAGVDGAPRHVHDGAICGLRAEPA